MQVRSNGLRLTAAGRLLGDGTVRVVVDSSYPLADVSRARARHERRYPGQDRADGRSRMTGVLVQGTTAWFAMVGVVIADAAAQVGIPPDLHLSVLKRYVDGAIMDVGLRQRLPVDIIRGSGTFRAGVLPGETADAVIEFKAATARRLNLLFSADPAYAQATAKAAKTGNLQIHGDLGALGPVFAFAHDRIVEQTR